MDMDMEFVILFCISALDMCNLANSSYKKKSNNVKRGKK